MGLTQRQHSNQPKRHVRSKWMEKKTKAKEATTELWPLNMLYVFYHTEKTNEPDHGRMNAVAWSYTNELNANVTHSIR